MNILYINHYAGSPKMGMEFRPYYLSREWVKQGHSVRIVAGDYSHLRIENPHIQNDFEESTIDGITYTWVRTGSYQGNGIARAKTMFHFVFCLWKRAKWIAKEWRPDVVITSSTYPLDTFAGQRIKKYADSILIHEVHDMWPITLLELGGMKKTNPFVVLMQIGENSFCKHSDFVVSLLCAADDYLVQHGMKPEKFKVVTNGIVLDEWADPSNLPQEHHDLLKRLHDEKKFIICFFGSITKSYAIDYLLRAYEMINNDKVAIVIVGEGNQKKELQEMAGDGVYFLPRISKEAIPTLMENIDCCYVGALHNDMFRFGISMNKLFDSMMSGKPILYAVDAPNDYIKEYSCGVSVKAEDAGALADGINQILSLSESERAQMGERGRNAVMEHFNYEKLAAKFAELFKKQEI